MRGPPRTGTGGCFLALWIVWTLGSNGCGGGVGKVVVGADGGGQTTKDAAIDVAAVDVVTIEGSGGGPAGAGGVGGDGSGGAAGVVDAGAAGAAGQADAADPPGDAGVLVLPATSLAVRFANAVMTRWPDPGSITTLNQWEYNHGIVLRGIEQVYRHTGDARYLAYIQRYVDQFVSAAGVVTVPSAHSFDNIQPSVLLPFLFQNTAMAKYHTAADQMRARYDTIPRNPDRGFWHKQTYPNQMWLDSIYMGEPFLMRYGATFGSCGTFCGDTVVEQVLLIATHVRDATTGLLYHAWDDSPTGAKAI